MEITNGIVDETKLQMPPPIGHNSGSGASIAAAELLQFIERIERLEEEKTTIGDDIKDVKSELKGRGYDLKAVNEILKIRKQDASERAEQQSILETYLLALGMAPEQVL
jgi:uncharacterized protein (UPF0335 family)